MAGVRLLTAGESHGPALVGILEGIPAGLPLNEEAISRDLARRQRGPGAGARMTLESDTARILSGVMAGRTTGGPIALLIENRDHTNWRGRPIPAMTIPRPGHADLAGALKYGHDDFRLVLERASARETAMRVAAGAICRLFLEGLGIRIGGYVAAIGPVTANLAALSFEQRLEKAALQPTGCPDATAAVEMEAAIRQAADAGETLGGIIEAVALGVPPGLGSFVQGDRRLDARLGAALLSIPAVKGVEIGPAFQNSRLPGTKVHDPIQLQDGRIVRPSARSGGIEGGVSTGQPIWIRAALKPIPTTMTPQASVDMTAGVSAQTRYERSDVCPVPRAVVVIEAALALVLADALLEKTGGDSLAEVTARWAALPKGRLEEYHLTGRPQVFWP